MYINLLLYNVQSSQKPSKLAVHYNLVILNHEVPTKGVFINIIQVCPRMTQKMLMTRTPLMDLIVVEGTLVLKIFLVSRSNEKQRKKSRQNAGKKNKWICHRYVDLFQPGEIAHVKKSVRILSDVYIGGSRGGDHPPPDISVGKFRACRKI